MKKQYKLILLAVAALGVIGIGTLAVVFISSHNLAVLNPKGTIADQQLQLMITPAGLLATIVLPVLARTFGIAWRYRAGNKKAKYSPDLAGNKWAETIWWLIPFAIIAVLAVIAWTSSHALDPYKPLVSNRKPLEVQVIALQWKWLFIYPKQHIATINYLQLPKDTPINFTITSDAPMNSFWIPQLGGQVYAMTGMSTRLHLMASQNGDYRGQSANISGEGFAGMKFTTHVSDETDFEKWIDSVQGSAGAELTPQKYDELTKPTKDVPPAHYIFPVSSDDLYDTVVMKYMTPGEHH